MPANVPSPPTSPKTRPTVVLVSSRHQGGPVRGGERQLLYLAEGLAARGWRVILVVPPTGSLLREVRQRGLPHLTLRLRPEFSPLAFARLYRLLRNSGATVLHLNDSHAISMGIYARLLRAAPVVVAHKRLTTTPHHIHKYVWGTDVIIGVSRGVVRVMIDAGYPPERLAVVYSGVDPVFTTFSGSREEARRRLDLPEGPQLFTMVAAFAPEKDHLGLLSAFAGEFGPGEPVHLCLVGDGPTMPAVRKRIATLRLEGRVHLTGTLHGEPLLWAYRAADAALLITRVEGLGTTLLEAQAMGIPVVASAVPGVDEAVEEGRSGLLVPPGDEAALRRALRRLAADAGLRERLGRAGRARVEESFTSDRMVEGVLAVYRRLLAAR